MNTSIQFYQNKFDTIYNNAKSYRDQLHDGIIKDEINDEDLKDEYNKLYKVANEGVKNIIKDNSNKLDNAINELCQIIHNSLSTVSTAISMEKFPLYTKVFGKGDYNETLNNIAKMIERLGLLKVGKTNEKLEQLQQIDDKIDAKSKEFYIVIEELKKKIANQ